MAIITQTHTIRLRERGQVTIPRAVREELAAREGDVLTLVQLTPRQSRVPALTEQFTAEMEKGEVSLSELLQGLAEERATIHRERQQAQPESDA
jgi:bifunctional DNA-binding transcriptional regulator/antitoxin component of YhaV-PrlF toxin-antitoxin module